MSTDQERKICTAPKGKTRIVYFDARDHSPSVELDVDTPAKAIAILGTMMLARRASMSVFNDKGEQLKLS